MAVKGLQALYNLILKDVVKGSGQASGIMSIGKDVRKLADKKLQTYITAAQKQGVDLDNMSEQEIRYILELNKPKAPKVYSNQEAAKYLEMFLNQNKKGDVVDLTGKKLDTSQGIMGGKSVKELMESGQVQKGTQGLKKSDKVVKREMFEEANEKFNKTDEVVTVDSVITGIKKLEPIEAMKEANRVLKGEGRYKNLSKVDREKIAMDESVTDHIFEREIKPDPEDMAQGGRAGHYTGGMVDVEPSLSDIGHGSDSLMARTRLISPNNQATTSTGLNYLLAEDNDNIRVPFSKGKLADAGRRTFLKLMGSVGAGIGAAKAGLGSLFKAGKPVTKAAEVITTPNAPGKPEWFDALVTKVIREGDDVTKKFATKEREIVHSKKIDEDATVTVTRDLDEGTVRVDIDDVTTNVADEQGNAIVSMEVKGGRLEEGVKGKTPAEFEAVETDYGNYLDRGGEDYTTEAVENTVSNTKDLTADLTKVKMYAKGQKKPTIKEMMIQRERARDLKLAEENPAEYASGRQPDIDYNDGNYYDDYASGGRIGFNKGKLAQVSARKFLEKVFGKEKFENIIRNDPEMHRGMLEVVEMFRNKDKEKLKMYLQKFLPHMDDAQIEDFIIGSGDTAGIEGQLIRLGSGRDYAGKIEMMKRLERNQALRDLDVSEMKPNAEGGRVGLFLGGGLKAGKGQLRKLLEYMAEGASHGKTGSEILQMLNPKQFNKMLNDPATMGKFTAEAPEGIPGLVKEYIKKMNIDRSKMVEDLIGTGRKIKKSDDDIIKYKMTIIEDMVSKGMDRKTAENMAETLATMMEQQAGKKATPKITDQGLLEMENIQKNLLTKDRKLQATGGLTTMLGE